MSSAMEQPSARAMKEGRWREALQILGETKECKLDVVRYNAAIGACERFASNSSSYAFSTKVNMSKRADAFTWAIAWRCWMQAIPSGADRRYRRAWPWPRVSGIPTVATLRAS